jgi:hypothetical protein
MNENLRSTKKPEVFLLFLSIIILITSPAQAAWVPLTGNPIPISSIPAGGLAFGDLIIADFELFGFGEGGAISPSADTVFIQGGQDNASGDYGLCFLLSWQAGSEQIITVPSLNFTVSAVPDAGPIENVSLHIIGAFATGTGVVNVGETVWDGPFPGGTLIGSLSTSKQNGDDDAFLSNDTGFEPINKIYVRKSFTVTGGTNGTGFMDETFQFYGQIPEPATVILLGLGSLALLRIRKR